jgi:hypothetical protein
MGVVRGTRGKAGQMTEDKRDEYEKVSEAAMRLMSDEQLAEMRARLDELDRTEPEKMPRLEPRTCEQCSRPYRAQEGSPRTMCARCERKSAHERRDARARAAVVSRARRQKS